jgi:2-polyprenyl-3-methyl-5-hydroxy-6-metoxy-1,4-benzoquinol methylase
VSLRLWVLLATQDRAMGAEQSAPYYFIMDYYIPKFLKEILFSNNIRRVLDLGAGVGRLSTYCAGFGATVDAVDIKPFPPELHKNSHIKLFNADIEQWLDSNDQKYDLIILRSILHYFSPEIVHKKILPLVREKLNKSGHLYIATITPIPNSNKFPHTPEEIIKSLPALILKAREEVVTNVEGVKQTFWHFLFKN